MLNSILISNWRSHASTRIAFSPGANIFLGPMGSGKSSVVDALCFALYGTYPRLGRRDAAIEDVANFRHAEQMVSVEVEWTEDEGRAGAGAQEGGARGGAAGEGPPPSARGGRHYRVRRELAPAQAWIYADGKLVQKGPRAVSEEVERILQISYELFARAVYSEQNRLDYWLSLGPGPRKSELDRLLGLDLFERARTGAVGAAGRLREQAGALEASAPPDKWEAAQAARQARQESLGAREAEMEAVRARLAEQTVELQRLQREFDEGERQERARQEWEGKRQKLDGTVLALEQSLAGMGEIGSVEELRAGLEWARAQRQQEEKEAGARQEAEREATARVGRLKAQLRSDGERERRAVQLQAQLDKTLESQTLETRREQVKRAAESLTGQLAEEAKMEAGLADARKLLLALEVAEHQISDAGGSGKMACPVCAQPMDTMRQLHIKKEQAAAIEGLVARVAEHKKAIQMARGAHEKEVAREAEASRLSAQLAALSGGAEAANWGEELALAQKMADEHRAGAASAGERWRALMVQESQLAHRLKTREQMELAQTHLEEARKQRNEAEKHLAALQKPVQGWATIVQNREEKMREVAAAESQRQALGRLVESERQMLQAAQLVVADLAERRKQALQLRGKMDELGAFRQVLAATQTQMRQMMLEQINAALGRLWPLLYPYGDWTSVRVVGGEKDYALEIYQGKWMPLEAHASGGERACLGLALRAALSILLTPQLGWLILDEPTHNLDGPAVSRLGRALAEKMPQVIAQVIVITHDTQLVESTPGRVVRFARDREKGEDTGVEME